MEFHQPLPKTVTTPPTAPQNLIHLCKKMHRVSIDYIYPLPKKVVWEKSLGVTTTPLGDEG